MIDWDRYFEAVGSAPLNPFFGSLEPHLPKPGLAYDLGCGAGQASERLADLGWRVIAVDADERALTLARRRLSDCTSVSVHQERIEDVDFEPCRCVLAMFVLFLLPVTELEPLVTKAFEALEPGGIFAGQLLGPNDEWATMDASSLTLTGVHNLLSRFEMVNLNDVERDGKLVQGDPKHWHVYHFIARKR